MGKFKVGDRVRRVKESEWPEEFGVVGEAYTVLSVSSYYTISVIKGKNSSADAFELLPAWQPKVGDLVLVTDNMTPGGSPIEEYEVGKEYFVTGICKDPSGNDAVELRDHYQYLRHDQFTKPATLTIEAGKFYKTRDGRKVGPMERFDDDSWSSSDGMLWVDNGKRYFEEDRGGPTDLLAPWEEPIAVAASNDNAAVAKPSGDVRPDAGGGFKAGDRIRCVASPTRGSCELGDEFVAVKWDDSMGFSSSVHFTGKDGEVSWRPPSCFELVGTPTTPAIIALIENGTPRPSTAPKVHTSQEAATTEAERLALEHPGQTFGVFFLADSKIADLVTTQTAVLRAA